MSINLKGKGGSAKSEHMRGWVIGSEANLTHVASPF